MSNSDSDRQQDTDTLQHLLGVVVENREKRCQEVKDNARQEADEIIRQAHSRVRGRLHRHVNALRETDRLRVASATARNQTLLRQQHQKEERALLDMAWPLLHDAVLALWRQAESRHRWVDAAVGLATERLRDRNWRIEHPPDFSEDDKDSIRQNFPADNQPALAPCDDIEAGIRIVVDGTVVDASLAGLLKQRTSVEARMIARIKQALARHD